jgi:hypothetical protein
MEVKNLKMTYNMEYSDCIESSFPVLLDIISQLEGSDDAGKRAKNIQGFLTEWKGFFKDFVRETPDQFTLIRATEIYCGSKELFASMFHIITQVFYTLKVVAGPIIKQWS